MTAETTTKTKNSSNTNRGSHHHATKLPVQPTVMLPTISSSILNDRLSKYQRGQLGHLNWIVSHYLRPQDEHPSNNHNINHNRPSPSSALSTKKRSRMVVEEHAKNNDTNQQRPDEPSNETNHVPATTASNRSDDAEEYKKARQILTHYVDRMRGGMSTTLVPNNNLDVDNANSSINHHHIDAE